MSMFLLGVAAVYVISFLVLIVLFWTGIGDSRAELRTIRAQENRSAGGQRRVQSPASGADTPGSGSAPGRSVVPARAA